MIYPDHHIRLYCIYLGSLEIGYREYDMGVYVRPDGSVSHAIVYGSEPSEYFSGEFIFRGELLDERYRFSSFFYKVNETLFQEYIKNPLTFPQPAKQEV